MSQSTVSVTIQPQVGGSVVANAQLTGDPPFSVQISVQRPDAKNPEFVIVEVGADEIKVVQVEADEVEAIAASA